MPDYWGVRSRQDKESYVSDTQHAEKVIFFFKDKESYVSDTPHAEKVIFFFKDKESYVSDTSRFFKDKKLQ